MSPPPDGTGFLLRPGEGRVTARNLSSARLAGVTRSQQAAYNRALRGGANPRQAATVAREAGGTRRRGREVAKTR